MSDHLPFKPSTLYKLQIARETSEQALSMIREEYDRRLLPILRQYVKENASVTEADLNGAVSNFRGLLDINVKSIKILRKRTNQYKRQAKKERS
jgi:hypothetical protein